jgi:Uri superfamily endonuclease
VGSAQKNMEHRVKRHLRKEKHKFWHIDYLLESKAATVVEILFRKGDKTEECNVARFIANKGEQVNGFGCSDCRCESHLLRILDSQFLRESMQTLNVKPEKLGIE